MAGRLLGQFTRSATLAGGGLLGALAVAFWMQAESSAAAEVATANQVIATEVAVGLPGEEWSTLWDSLPEPGDVRAWSAHGDELAAAHDRVSGLVARNGLVRIRALHPSRKADGSPGNADGTCEIGLSSSTSPHWRTQLPADHASGRAWMDGKSQAIDEVAGKPVLRSYSRIDDAHGRPVMLLEIASPMSDALWHARSWGAGVFLLLTGLLAAVGVFARRAVIAAEADVVALREQVEGLGGEAVHEPWTGPQITVSPRLAKLIEDARGALSSRLRDLDDRLGVTSRDLASAETVLEPDANVRRAAFAELALQPNIVLEATGGRTDTVELVDLSFDYLVVRVSKYTMVDLAPGMPATVAWTGSDNGQQLLLDRRIERESELEYVFRVSPPRMLPGTPANVSRLAYARRVARVACEGTEVRAMVLAGTGGPIEATVLDLSPLGLGLRLRADPGDLAATGTTATVQLKLSEGGPEHQVGVIIRNVRPRPGGCDVGCAIDPTMTVNHDDLKAVLTTWCEQRRRTLAAAAATSSSKAA